MKILYVGNLMGFRNAAHYYKIPQKLLNGLIGAGHCVYAFNDRDHARASTMFRSRFFGAKKVGPNLLKAVEEFRPHLIILTAQMVSDEVLGEIRTRHPAIRLIYMNVDSLTQENNAEKIRRKVGMVDGIFITTGDKAIKQFETAGTFVRFVPNPVDARIDTGRSFAEENHAYDVFLAANIIRDDDDPRIRLIGKLKENLTDMRLGLFGTAGNGRMLLGAEYMETLASSRIGLSLNRNEDFLLYASDRMTHYLGNGVLTALRRGQGFEEWFGEDEALYFDHADDLCEAIRSVLSDDRLWRQKAEKGHARAHRLFASERIAKYMIECTFQLPYSDAYEWPCH